MLSDVSVLLTCYNEAAYITQAVESVMRQTAIARVAKVVVVDDGSTDESPSVLRALSTRHPLLEVVSIANSGLPAARNAGLARISSPLTAILDGDDVWAPDKLDLQLRDIASAPPSVALWYGDVREFTIAPEQSRPIRVRRYRGDEADTLAAYFLHDGPIIPSTVVFRMDAAGSVGFFDPKKRLFEDTDFYLRLAEKGFGFRHVADALTYKRKRGDSLSARIDRWETAMLATTQEWSARAPRLARLAGRRDAHRLTKIADAYFEARAWKRAWSALLNAAARNPRDLRIYGYAGLAWLPVSTRAAVKGLGRRLAAGRGAARAG
jgi:glycosyltransferase involved in cell wall biosynthesis